MMLKPNIKKNMRKQIALIAFISSLLIGATAYAGSCSGCGSAHKDKGSYNTTASNDIVETAVEAGNFSTLVAAVEAAGLVDTLKTPGPFTVFAPTDAAFAKLPAGTVENLLKPENKDQLVAILTYHVVPAKVKSKDVATGEVPTVNGKKLMAKVGDGKVMVNDAQVVVTDIACSNGVIHVIDSVILPPASGEAVSSL